ncbi:MAG: hypothetical protein H7641_09060 [Candidatus Heimdallarchaeota archaeon]|nr:hypothetical protein [Candidatus Heimdallarchaeota archaeon]MCK4877715.1 hypothetical protein [Candidatus Heimdallarchaeota archaeon]
MSTMFDYLDSSQKKIKEDKIKEKELNEKLLEKIKKQKKVDVNFAGFDGRLSELVDGIRTIPNYQNIKSFIRDKILTEEPGISYKKLSVKAGVHKGVALVILYDLYNDKLEEELKEIEEENGFSYNYS